MALNLENNDTNNTAAPVAQPQAQQPQYSNVSGGQTTVSPVGLGGRLSALGMRPGHIKVQKLKDQTVELLKTVADTSAVAYRLLDVPACSDLSGFIVTGYFKDKPDLVSAHILLMDGTSQTDRIKAMVPIQIGPNQTYQVYRQPSDYVNDRLLTEALAVCRNAYPNASIRYCDSHVVPADYDVELDNLPLIENFTGAVLTDLAQTLGRYEPLNLGDGSCKTGLCIDQEYQLVQLSSPDGMPVRSDIIASMYLNRNLAVTSRNELNGADGQIPLVEVSAAIDLVYNPESPRNPFSPNNPQRSHVTVTPRVVLTDIRCNQFRTTDRLALALATAFTIGQNNYWRQSFKPTGNPRGFRERLRKIGALNIDANLMDEPGQFGQVIEPINGTEYSLDEVISILNGCVSQNPIFSVDVPDAGATSWYMRVLTQATNPGQGYDELYDAFNVLTNGSFGKFFPRGTAIFNNQATDRYLTGYFVGDASGDKMDRRCLDYLACANIAGAKDPNFLVEWSNTFTELGVHPEVRLQKRSEMELSMTNEMVVCTGKGTRLTFTQEFIMAVSKAMHAIEVPVDVKTPLSGDFSNQRAAAGWMNGSVVGGMGDVFNRNNVRQSNFGFGGVTQNRW